MKKCIVLIVIFIILDILAWVGIPLNVYQPMLGILPLPILVWGIIFILEELIFWLVAYKWDIYNINDENNGVVK